MSSRTRVRSRSSPPCARSLLVDRSSAPVSPAGVSWKARPTVFRSLPASPRCWRCLPRSQQRRDRPRARAQREDGAEPCLERARQAPGPRPDAGSAADARAALSARLGLARDARPIRGEVPQARVELATFRLGGGCSIPIIAAGLVLAGAAAGKILLGVTVGLSVGALAVARRLHLGYVAALEGSLQRRAGEVPDPLQDEGSALLQTVGGFDLSGIRQRPVSRPS